MNGLPTSGQTIYFAERATDDSGNTSLIARTKLKTNYVRPKGATPLHTYLTIAYKPCISSNRTHGPPLSFASCSPPQQASGQVTVGTADANGRPTKSLGSITYKVAAADVRIDASIIDVRKKSDLSDYSGQLQTDQTLRITDRRNGPDQDEAATSADTNFPATVPCTVTADTTIGSTCALTTTANALVPGAVRAGDRAIWALGPAQVYDGGPDGVAATQPNTLFEDQGIFVP